MTENKPGMKLERRGKTQAKEVAERKSFISSGDNLPKNGPGLNKLATIAKTYQLTPRTVNLLTLAVNADKAEGRRATLTGKVEDAIIRAYGHLDAEG